MALTVVILFLQPSLLPAGVEEDIPKALRGSLVVPGVEVTMARPAVRELLIKDLLAVMATAAATDPVGVVEERAVSVLPLPRPLPETVALVLHLRLLDQWSLAAAEAGEEPKAAEPQERQQVAVETVVHLPIQP